MLTNEEISNRLFLNEGFRTKKYKCSRGFWTIGVGRNLDANPETNKELGRTDNLDSGISKPEAIILLMNDIKKVRKEVEDKIPCLHNLNYDRLYAIIDMAFQMGTSGLLKFKNMLSALGLGDWKKAHDECLNSNYAKQTPNRAKRIAETFLTGVYKNV